LAAALTPTATPSTGTLLSATQVGPLRLGTATPAQLRAWAGKPGRVWRFAGRGEIPSAGLFAFRTQVLGYGCAASGCTTFYAFKGGHLVGFHTRSTAFHTQAGTRVGTSLTRALLQEKTANWAGFSVQCPALLLPATGSTLFKADVGRTPPRVADFLVTLAPQSFSDGC
jgi:hypothetical protein